MTEGMILSASGWRGVFAVSGDENDDTNQISERFITVCGAAACVFSQYLRSMNKNPGNEGDFCKPIVFLGIDTRPTGKTIVDVMIPVLHACGCEVHYAGFVAAPEIMAWARSGQGAGFIYISASHNPIGHNGIKFGLTDGGVLPAEEANKLIADFYSFMTKNDSIEKIKSFISASDPALIADVYNRAAANKTIAYQAYFDFCGKVVFGGNTDISGSIKDGLAKKPLGVVCDFNGSARTVSIDRNFFSSIGFLFESINDKPGQIVHSIVPEGESLDPCCKLLEKIRERDSSFVLGYVPDCDGDRGNLVIYDDRAGRARALEAQEVFALSVVAELAHLVWTGELQYDSNGKALNKAAVVVNDPTSMRIDRIAEAFGVSVFRAEVGEANVVSLARKLREDGCIVRILGEGSAGGNITHPSAVRDPISTVMAIAKMLSIRSKEGKQGFFEIWCNLSGQKYRGDFTLAEIIASLPAFITTPAYSKDAVLRISTSDHSVLKDRYQKIFLQEWEERKDDLKKRFGFSGWEAIAYNGIIEKRGINRFGEAQKGGLKICFFDSEGKETAFIWMRGSATEPVFRIMEDVCGTDASLAQYLLDWQNHMIMKADGFETRG